METVHRRDEIEAESKMLSQGEKVKDKRILARRNLCRKLRNTILQTRTYYYEA